MKKNILYADVTKAIEDLALALRKYSSAPMYCNVTIVSRDAVRDEDEAPDVYVVRLHEADGSTPIGSVTISESGLIFYDSDDKIIKVERDEDGGAS